MRSYDFKQADAQRDLNERTREVYEAVPEYKQIQDAIATTSMEATVASIKGNAALSAELSAKITTLGKQLDDVLTAAGFPADYLKPRYACPICKDKGFVNNQKCSCFIQASIDLLYKQSNIQSILGSESFSDFSLDYYSTEYRDSNLGLTAKENAADVLGTCKDFAAAFPQGDNILFYGDTGVGKTFLSGCIARELLDNAHSVLYLSAIDLFNTFSINMESDQTPEQITECELLIIDDLGTELSNSFTNSKLFYCINSRLLEGKSTIISTNLTLKDLMERYSERIFSRISSSYKLLKLFGDDIRFIKK